MSSPKPVQPTPPPQPKPQQPTYKKPERGFIGDSVDTRKSKAN